MINSTLESIPSSNIPELCKLSKQLVETESQLSAFWLVCPDLKIMAKNGRFIKVSPSCTKILGYTQDELMATDFMNFVHPDDVDATTIALTFLDENCSISNFKNRLKHKTENR